MLKFKNAGSGGVSYSTLTLDSGEDDFGDEAVTVEMACKDDGIDGSVVLNVEQVEKLTLALTAWLKKNKPKAEKKPKLVDGTLI